LIFVFTKHKHGLLAQSIYKVLELIYHWYELDRDRFGDITEVSLIC